MLDVLAILMPGNHIEQVLWGDFGPLAWLAQ